MAAPRGYPPGRAPAQPEKQRPNREQAATYPPPPSAVRSFPRLAVFRGRPRETSMSQSNDKAAILSKTLHFLTAGGLALALAIVQEITKPHPDWGVIATTVAGILVGIGGGAYGRVVAQG